MREFKEEEDPQKPNLQKVGVLLLLLMVVMIVYFIDGLGIFSDEEEVLCDPMLEDCERTKIIVRLIGNYEQLISNT